MLLVLQICLCVLVGSLLGSMVCFIREVPGRLAQRNQTKQNRAGEQRLRGLAPIRQSRDLGSNRVLPKRPSRSTGPSRPRPKLLVVTGEGTSKDQG